MYITTTAIYENGVLRPLAPLTLPEHTHVQLQIEPITEESTHSNQDTLQRLLTLATDLGVDDLAEQHDHYLYGAEKQ